MSAGDQDASRVVFMAEPPRQCGSCTLCCSLMPVREIAKPRDTRCRHLKFGKRCSIYATRPRSCATFSCLWLMQPDLLPSGWLRPDHCRVVFDPAPDYVTLRYEDGSSHDMDAQQLWVDPMTPGAHRDPRVRAVIARLAERHGILTLARIGDVGLVIGAPIFSADGQWQEKVSEIAQRDQPNPMIEMADRLQFS